MQSKVAVVTGASRGIGYETALLLAKNGYHIIALARTIGGLEELDDAIQKAGGSATLVPIDMTDTTKLQALGPNLLTRFDHVDLVVGCAGYLSKLTSVAQGPADHFTKALALNAAANVTLIQTLHPLLKRAAQPKAVFLTADEKYLGKAYWGFYGASKAALNAIVASYADENPEMAVSTYSPRATKTRLHEEAFPGIADVQSPAQTALDIWTYLSQENKKAA